LAAEETTSTIVSLTPLSGPASPSSSALDSLLSGPSAVDAKYPPYFFVSESTTPVKPQVEFARLAMDAVRFEPAPLPSADASTSPEAPITEPPPAPPAVASTETPTSRRAAPVLAWMISLSCLLLLRDPQRLRPVLNKPAPPKRTRGAAERNVPRPLVCR
jgi:hypothetical protein